MKKQNIFRHAITILICIFSTISHANDPTLVPWPVGTTTSQMNFTKTLMNSYGDPNGPWRAGMFHAGVDSTPISVLMFDALSITQLSRIGSGRLLNLTLCPENG